MKITLHSIPPCPPTFSELAIQGYFVFADNYRQTGDTTIYRKHIYSEAVDLVSPFTCHVAPDVRVFRVEITHVVAQVIGGCQ